VAAKQSDKKTTRLPAVRAEDKPDPGLGKLSGLQDVDVRITVEWGRTQITVEEALQLGEEALLAVDQRASEPVDVLVNGMLFGRGKLVLVGDSYGVQLTEIVDQEE